VPGSYYTAYPPTGVWSKGFDHYHYIGALKEAFSKRLDLPLQLYIHFPFCKTQCWYCQCIQVITKSETKIKKSVEYLTKEIDLLINFFNSIGVAPNFKEIHLGGGSPSYMGEEEFDMLINKLLSFININNLSEFAIEIDPRTVSKEKMKYYHGKGINRISFGIQDLDPVVQGAINRIQPIELVEELLETRGLFSCVNFDLIYGLPLQTRESFKSTIDKVIKLSPDRIDLSIFGYRPDIFKHNRLIEKSTLPSLIDSKLMWDDSRINLEAHGYKRIGMDHFAKCTDALTIAKKNKTLFRNPLGYSPGRFHDTVSIGPSGMTKIADYYFQNTYMLPDYYSAIDEDLLPVFRGYRLSEDDLIRRDIINQLMTYDQLDFSELEQKYVINFNQYFRREIDLLSTFVKEGILDVSDNMATVTPLGSFFLRNICMAFDNLRKDYRHNAESVA